MKKKVTLCFCLFALVLAPLSVQAGKSKLDTSKSDDVIIPHSKNSAMSLSSASLSSHRTPRTPGAVIYNSILPANQKIALGVNREGHLNTTPDIVRNASATGLAIKWPSGVPGGSEGQWYDATSPGCLCEGWGVSGNGQVGRADVSVGGVSGLRVKSFENSIANIVSVTEMGPTGAEILEITHDYRPSPESDHTLFEGLVTITNISNKVVKDVRYRREMDWDIPPTEFSEYVSHFGVSTSLAAEKKPKLICSDDNGFQYPNPLDRCRPIRSGTHNTDFEHNGPADHGSTFNFAFPDLNCGESISFMIYYGVANTREEAKTAMKKVGAEVYSFGASRVARDGITFIFGFKGISGTKLPVEIPPKAGSLPSITKAQTFNKVFPFDNALYQSTFKYRKDKQWKGSLKKYNLNDDGTISATGIIDAGEKLKIKKSADRNIWTVANGSLTSSRSNNNFLTSNKATLKDALFRDATTIPSDEEVEDLINFVRGVDVYDENLNGNFTEDRDWKLADIFHADLTIAPPPKNLDTSKNIKSRAVYKNTRSPAYNSFVSENSARKTILYAAANDGMLHAFDSSTMEERWAFVPPPALDKIRAIFNTKGDGDVLKGKTNSVYLVDGTPTIKDIFYDGEWRTVLMAGLGYAGKAYYALDITNPDSPSHLFSFMHNNEKRIVDYWDGSGARTTYDYVEEAIADALNYSKLGEAWARPFITLMPYNGQMKWVAVLGGGFAGIDGAAVGFGRYVYIIDLEPNTLHSDKIGTVLKAVELKPLDPEVSDIPNGIVSAISALSVDSSSSLDLYGSIIYLADLQGKTWKLDLAKVSVADPDSKLFSVETHFNGEATLDNDRLMYQKPSISFIDGVPFNFIGTGDMIRLERQADSIKNRIFGVKDLDYPATGNIDKSIPYTISKLRNAASKTCPTSKQKGWYQDLSSVVSPSKGAKVVGSAASFSGSKDVYFPIYVPSGEEFCASEGNSHLVTLTKACGIQEVGADKIGKGIATTPVIYKGSIYIGIGNKDEKDASEGGAPNVYTKSLVDRDKASEGDEKSYSIKSWRESF
jgi:type IV pilus assembly protein PilY1